MKFFKITNKIYYNPDHHSQPKTLLLQKLKRNSTIFFTTGNHSCFLPEYTKLKRYCNGGRIWPLQDQPYVVQREELLSRVFKEVSLLDNNHYSLSVEDNS